MRRLKEHIYKFGEVVIGGGLNAAMYAYSNGSVLVDCGVNTPCEFISIGGLDKRELYEDLRFQMSIAGNLPFSDKVESMRVSDSTLRVSTKNYRLIKANFDNLVIFDDTSIYGLNPPFKKNFGKYLVLDWFDVRSGMRHDNDSLSSDSEFVSEVRFYNSRRIGTKKGDKDLVAMSHLTKKQLEDIEYSDLYVKFKTLDMILLFPSFISVFKLDALLITLRISYCSPETGVNPKFVTNI